MQTLAEKLTRLREARAVDRGVLATKAGVDYNYLYRLERGLRRNPSLAVLGRLAQALGLSVEELVADTSYAPALPAPVQALAERVSDLPQPLRTAVTEALGGFVAVIEEHLLAHSAATRAMLELGAALTEAEQEEVLQAALAVLQRRASPPASAVSPAGAELR